MPSRLAHTPDATDQRRLFRQSGAMVLGIVTIVICAVILVFGLWSMHRLHAVDIAWPIAVALLAWVLFVRPCVVLTEQAVVIRNLVREVQIPWAAVESTQSRWNLKVVTTGGAGYGSWAITTQRRRVPRAQRIGLGMGNFRSRAERKQPIDVGAYLNGPERAQSAAAVAASIDEMKAASAPQATGDTGVRVQPAWWGIAGLGAAVVLIVVGLLG